MSSPSDAVPPLVVEFTVDAPPDHAFTTFTARTALWWPKGHTITGDPSAIVIEPRVGGRLFELGPDGREHTWGEVVAWDPPTRLAFLWHLFFDRSQATHVDVQFGPRGDDTSAVRLVQSGWEALGDDGPPRRERTAAGWAAVTRPYRDLLTP